MSLATLQRAFQAAVVAEDGEAETEPARGMSVYRNAYRARLLDCLRGSFDKTLAWIGDEAFTAAACHHVIVERPHSWTLDDLGQGFDATLALLFPTDPEVAELAWLERAMEDVFTVRDVTAMTPDTFAARTAGYTDAEWSALRLRAVPASATRVVTTDCAALWTAIDAGTQPNEWALDEPQTLLVWRASLRPQFRLLDAAEARALAELSRGVGFGAICEAVVATLGPPGVETAGKYLGRWLADGLLQENPEDA